MMQFYHVKTDLPGMAAGRVEPFHSERAAFWLRQDAIEPYDPKRHGKLPGAPAAAVDTSGRQPIKK